MNRLYRTFRVEVIFLVWMGLPIHTHAQAQKTWQWVKHLGGDSWDISAGVACDSKNNLYVAGSFYDTLNCGSKKVKSAGNQDVFVAMFNENGDLKDIMTGGGKGRDLATCICITPGDNIAIGGVLSDTATFENLKNTGTGQRLFVATLEAKGKFTWTSTITMTGEASLFMIGADNQGSIYVSGVFTGTLEAEGQKVISNGKKDGFLARFNKTGTVEKLFSFGSEEDDSPGSLSVDASGNLILAGDFGKSFEIGGIKLSQGPNGTKTNVFLVKFDRDFKAQWANVLQGDDYVQVASLKHDNSGNLYATGSFSSKMHVADTVLTSGGYTDAFLLKYKSDGKLEWCRGFGSWYYDYASHVNIDNVGRAITTGSMGEVLEIDSLVVTPISKDNSAMVVQFSPMGKAIWADCISGQGRNFTNGSVLDMKGNLYLTGSFRNTFEKGGNALTSFGDQDVFLAKYYNCPSIKAEIFGQRSFCPGTGSELSVKNSFTNVVWNDTLAGKNHILANKPGRYWVSMLDKKGCLVTDTIMVTQNLLPFFSLGNDTTILVSDSLLLKAPGKYTRYQWNNYSTESTYLAKPVDTKTGTVLYWLTVTDSLYCNYSDTISISYLKGYNLVDLGKIQLVIYPNPSTDQVNWFIKTDEACQLVEELTDIYGRVLYHQYFKQYLPGEVKQINLGNMPAGIYNLRISNSSVGKSFKTVRVIKQ